MPVDYTTDVGKVRALIPDVEEVDYRNDGTATYLFEDGQIEAYLNMHSASAGHIYFAAADAVGALATSEAYISKAIRTEDLQTDGAKVANALFVRVQNLRNEGEREEERELQDAFDIIPYIPHPPQFWPR